MKIGGINIYILDMVQKQLKKVKAAADRSSTKRKNVPSKSKEKVNMADKKFRKVSSHIDYEFAPVIYENDVRKLFTLTV